MSAGIGAPYVGVGGRRHAAFPRPSRDPARGGGAAGRRLSSVINRAPILALLCAKNERVFAKTAPRSRQPCALVGDWAAIDVSLRPRVCRSLQGVFGRFVSERFLVPLENPRFSHICFIYSQLLDFWCPLLGRLSARNRGFSLISIGIQENPIVLEGGRGFLEDFSRILEDSRRFCK